MVPLVHVRVAALVLAHVTVALPPCAMLLGEMLMVQLAVPGVGGVGGVGSVSHEPETTALLLELLEEPPLPLAAPLLAPAAPQPTAALLLELLLAPFPALAPLPVAV
jgi:hypothetical protein